MSSTTSTEIKLNEDLSLLRTGVKNDDERIPTLEELNKLTGEQLFNLYKQGITIYDFHREKIYEYIIENNLKGHLLDREKLSLFNIDHLHNLNMLGVFTFNLTTNYKPSTEIKLNEEKFLSKYSDKNCLSEYIDKHGEEIKFNEEKYDNNDELIIPTEEEFKLLNENEKNILIRKYVANYYIFIIENNVKGNVFNCQMLDQFSKEQLFNLHKQGIYVYDKHREKIYQYIIENCFKEDLLDYEKLSQCNMDEVYNLYENVTSIYDISREKIYQYIIQTNLKENLSDYKKLSLLDMDQLYNLYEHGFVSLATTMFYSTSKENKINEEKNDEEDDEIVLTQEEFYKLNENDKNIVIKKYVDDVYIFLTKNNFKGLLINHDELNKFSGEQLFNLYKQGITIFDFHREKICEYIIENNLKGDLLDYKKLSLFNKDQLYNLFLQGVFVDNNLRTW